MLLFQKMFPKSPNTKIMHMKGEKSALKGKFCGVANTIAEAPKRRFEAKASKTTEKGRFFFFSHFTSPSEKPRRCRRDTDSSELSA